MKKHTLSRAFDLWKLSKESKQTDSNFEKYLKGAFKRYVLPGIDASTQNLKTKEFADYCTRLTVDKLQNALDVFDCQSEAAVVAGQISKGTKSNYRSALGRFLDWMHHQVWWRELFGEDVPEFMPPHPGEAPKKRRKQGSEYTLKENELPEDLVKELEEYKQFRLLGKKKEVRRRRRENGETTEHRSPKINKISQSTITREMQVILLFFGWYVNIEGNAITKVNLKLLTEIYLLEDYNDWSIENRGNSYCTGRILVVTSIAVTKFFNYEKSSRRDWSDIPAILDLKDLRSEYSEQYELEKQGYREEKWAQKEMTHEEARMIVQYLYECCAPRLKHVETRPNGTRKASTTIRPISSIVHAWQIYLIVKLLVFCPVRQQEIRNLEIGKTLFRKVNELGKPYYVVVLTDHKNYNKTGKRRHYKLPDIITRDLDAWLNTWRPMIVNAVKSLELWLEYWGRNSNQLEQIKKKIEATKQGVAGEQMRVSIEKYIQNLEKVARGLEHRIAALETCKNNIESHNSVFLLLPNTEPESFGKPIHQRSLHGMTVAAVAKASRALFGNERVFWTNPHAFRHIGEKQIRKINGNVEAFGTYIGHSKEMGDEYAEQITSEYEVTEGIADNWWEN